MSINESARHAMISRPEQIHMCVDKNSVKKRQTKYCESDKCFLVLTSGIYPEVVMPLVFVLNVIVNKGVV